VHTVVVVVVVAVMVVVVVVMVVVGVPSVFTTCADEHLPSKFT
jgi:hypothetical protein